MRALIFILSTVLILVAIYLVMKNKDGRFWGLELQKKWILGITIGEFLLIVLALIDYNQNANVDIANDLLWHNMISYYRGALPIAGLSEIVDLKINKLIPIGFLMYLGALLSDYIILKVASVIKNWIKK